MLFWERRTGFLRIIDSMTSVAFLVRYACIVTGMVIWWVIFLYRPLCLQELALRGALAAAAQQTPGVAKEVLACDRSRPLQIVAAFSQVDFLALVRRHGCRITTQFCKKPELVDDFLCHDLTVAMCCSYKQLCAVCCELETLPQVAIKELVVDTPIQGQVSVRIAVRILTKR